MYIEEELTSPKWERGGECYPRIYFQNKNIYKVS